MRLTEFFHLANSETKLSHETYLKISHLDPHNYATIETVKKARASSRKIEKDKIKEKKINKKKIEQFDLFD